LTWSPIRSTTRSTTSSLCIYIEALEPHLIDRVLIPDRPFNMLKVEGLVAEVSYNPGLNSHWSDTLQGLSSECPALVDRDRGRRTIHTLMFFYLKKWMRNQISIGV